MSCGRTRFPYRLLALAGALSASVWPAPATAQRYAYIEETEIGYSMGAAFVGDVVDTDEAGAFLGEIERLRVRDGAAFGLRLTRNLSTDWALEVGWSYVISELVGQSASSSREFTYDRLGVVEVGLSALLHPVWLAGERVGPYLRMGVGALAWRPGNAFRDFQRPLNTRRTSSLAQWVGLGAVVYATEDLALRADYSVAVARLDRDALLGLEYPFEEIGYRTVWAHHLSAGVSLRFFDTEL